MSLQDRIDAFKADFEAGKPPYNAPNWIHEPMHRATKELIDSGAASRAARYVIGQDGMIVYAEVNPDYTKRPDPSELLPALRGLRERRAA
jgi:hypothetical protein